jgi:hypothetical protein
MKSTPIFLDKLRHVRYPLNTIWDADFIVAGGFEALLLKNVDRDFIKLILWLGLKWEDPDLTMDNTGEIVNGLIEKGEKISDIVAVCTRALFDGGWYNKNIEGPEPESTQMRTQDRPTSIKDRILVSEKVAVSLGISRSEIWESTFAELQDTITSRNLKRIDDIEFARYQMGMICAAIYNAGYHPKDPVRWETFAGVPIKPQTAEQQASLLRGGFG